MDGESPRMEGPENEITCDTRSRVEKGAYTELQLFFLLRLEALLRLEREYTKTREAARPEGAFKVKLLHKAIYSTYRDCIDLGVGGAAKRLFEEVSAERGGSVRNG